MPTPTINTPRLVTGWRHIAPFAALFTLMLAWALGGLFVISREADRSDAARAREAVRRTFTTLQSRVDMAVMINAVDTDVAVALAGPVPDLNWLKTNFHFGSPDAIGFYGAIVLNADGSVVGGTYQGQPYPATDLAAAVRLITPLAKQLPLHGAGWSHALLRDAKGRPTLVAASNIMPDAGSRRSDLRLLPRRRVVMLHPVAQLLPKMQPLLGAENFRIDDGARGQNTLEIQVDDGPPLTFAWRPREPGRAAVVRWWPAMAGTLALASLLLGMAVRRSLAATHALRDLAERDQLTGLPNRGCLLGELDRRLARAPVALALMDLNGFKSINDTHGHLAGDDLLRAFAAEARGATAPGEIVARLGGDEFAFLGATLADAERFAAELTERLARPLEVGGLRLKISSGIGIAVARPGITARDLIALADARLYRDKAERQRVEGPPARGERTAVMIVA